MTAVRDESFALYLHIPFCYHKCPYCDFNTYAVTTIPEREYTSALLAELDYRASLPEWSGRAVSSMYFGGGTPSLLQPQTILKIIAAVSSRFPIEDSIEISLEANPGTVSLESLHGYREAGVNRLSIGAQSFSAELLKKLGRIHLPAQTEEAVMNARSSGFRNLSLDLMYGIPDQDLKAFEEDVSIALKLAPEHLSLYSLTIEKGTPFFASFKKGQLKIPHDDVVADMMESIQHALPARGYARYEVSNFSQPHRQALHNLAYWNSRDYMGLGAGAHSAVYLTEEEGAPLLPVRWSNVALPNRYIRDASAQGHAEAWRDALDLKAAIFDFIYLGLRKTAGISLLEFTQRFGQTVYEAYPAQIEVFAEQKLLAVNDGALALTPAGMMVLDSILEDLNEPRTSKPHLHPSPEAHVS
ncbi:MAG: radical SAM family heme chaperone HemW [Bdellovibrionota bacterium]|nr:MAG: radical SAM family heme chaperone HemW [Bdellovibrionota bacterium]